MRYNNIMTQPIDATYQHGVFRPNEPVAIPEGQRVLIRIEPLGAPADDLRDIADLLDRDVVETCAQSAGTAPSLEEVRAILSKIDGSLADRISEERDER
jgi:predicted DNA-binding antitoxin AbrB/MazE fold protein